MDATTPRAVDPKGRIALAQARRHHGPDSQEAKIAAGRVHFKEAWLSLRSAHEASTGMPAERATMAHQLYRLSLRFRDEEPS